MAINESIVVYFFTIANFLSVIAVFVYVLKKNVLGAIWAQMVQKKQYLSNLVFKKNKLEQERVSIEREIEKDELLCKVLKQKVVLWQEVVRKEYIAREEEALQREQDLASDMVVRIQQYTQQKLKKSVMSVALDQAEAQLAQQFANVHSGEKFINVIVAHMAKGDT